MTGSTDRRQHVDTKFIIQVSITLILSVGGAVLGSYIGTQTRTAVLENAFASLAKEMEGMRTQLTGITSMVNNANARNDADISGIQTDLKAKEREIDDLKREIERLRASGEDADKVANLKIESLNGKVATIIGEMNADRGEHRLPGGGTK